MPAGARFSGWNLDKLRGVARSGGSGSKQKGDRDRGGGGKRDREEGGRGRAAVTIAPPPSLAAPPSLSDSGPGIVMPAHVSVVDTVNITPAHQATLAALLERLMAAEKAGTDAAPPAAAAIAVPAAVTTSSSRSMDDVMVADVGTAPPSGERSEVREPPQASPAPAPQPAAAGVPSSGVSASDDGIVGSYAVYHYLTANLVFSDVWAKQVRAPSGA